MNYSKKLHIEDSGDPSVGIYPRYWVVETPFEQDEKVDKEDLEFFRSQQVALYNEYSEGWITASYDFELEAERLMELELDMAQQRSEEIFKAMEEGEPL